MHDLGVVPNGALGVNTHSGLIEYAGVASGLASSLITATAQRLDARGSVVMPGFVDSHTHLVYAGSRASDFYARAAGQTYQQIAQAGGGIASTVAATRQASSEDLLTLARTRLHRLYSAGTTSVEIKSGYGLSRDHELLALKVISQLADSSPGLVRRTFMGAHALPPEYAGRRHDYISKLCSMMPEIGMGGWADYCDVFIDPLAFSAEESRQLQAFAASAGLRLRVHADEFGDDGTAAWAAAHGAVSADHLGGVGEQGIAALAASNTVATLLPTSMFYTGHERYAPGRALIDAGCIVALASDHNPGSSLVYGMQFVLTLAALKMRMTPEECIVASTINGAHALELGAVTGSLELGKRADFIVLDLPDYRELPCQIGGDFVREVYMAGQPAKQGGQFLLRD